MKQQEVVTRLDQFFAVEQFNEQDGWTGFMDDAYRAAIQPYYETPFWEGTWNGLMLNNTDNVDRIYLVVFPTAAILDTIIAKEVGRGAPGAMIFAHHVAAFDEAAKGFIQIPVDQLAELQEHHISYYNCHAPLDCNVQISTSGALASALGLNDLERFADYYGGQAGVIGTVAPVTFETFAERLAKACELPRLRYDQVLHNGQKVRRVAVVAGGGGEPELIDEAAAKGADTFVTGHWHLFADSDFARTRREAFQTYLPQLSLNLLGASHYSSEMVVMRDRMKSWFEELGLEVHLLRQENPWGI